MTWNQYPQWNFQLIHDLIDMLNSLFHNNNNNNWSLINNEFQKDNGLAASIRSKKQSHFRRENFCRATICSHFTVALTFFALGCLFSKNNESDRSDKKTTTRSSWIKSAHNRLGWLTCTINSLPITQRTCTHACQGRLYSQLLGWLTGGHTRIRHVQASPLMLFQALNLLSTRSMRHHAMLIWGWLVISKMNVQLYAISKRTRTLFEGVWCFLTVSNPHVFQNGIDHSEPFSH